MEQLNDMIKRQCLNGRSYLETVDVEVLKRAKSYRDYMDGDSPFDD